MFTGHSFRRSSATLAANAGADITTLKRLGGWKSDKVANSYVEESLLTKRKIANINCEIIPSPEPPNKRGRFTFKTPKYCALPKPHSTSTFRHMSSSPEQETGGLSQYIVEEFQEEQQCLSNSIEYNDYVIEEHEQSRNKFNFTNCKVTINISSSK